MLIKQFKTQYHQFVFVSTYRKEVAAFCVKLKNEYGFRNFSWDGEKWCFTSPLYASMIRLEFPEVQIEEPMKTQVDLFELMQEQHAVIDSRAVELKAATESTLDAINGIKAELRPYQMIGVEFFVNNLGRGILADEPGTGKTLQSLAFATHTKKEKTLVICPASVKYNWQKEVKKWTKKKSFVISTGTENVDIMEADCDVFIINYDIVKKYHSLLKVMKWDCIVCDEAHYLKNPKSQRSKAVKDITRRVASILLLTGTPLLSRPAELFNLLNIIDSVTWNSYYDYTKRYCAGHEGRWGWDARGSSNIEELQGRINKYFLRRTKKDILKELPPKVFVSVPVKGGAKEMARYKLASEAFGQYLREVKKKNIKGNISAETLVQLNELRQLTTLMKYETAKEIIEDLVENGEKVVVFSVYNEPLLKLQAELKDSVLLIGSVDANTRQELVDKFQNDPNCKVFLGGMKSAGVGITLTASSNVVFLDFSWVPADHLQAQDRCHRIGSTGEAVTIYQLYAQNTIDEYMVEMLEEKQKIFNQLIEGQEADSARSMVKDMLGFISKATEQKTLDK